MIDDLLTPGRIEPLGPEPGASDAAWDEVCRRRRARTLRTQVAAGVGLVLVVMVGVLPSLNEGRRAAELDVAGRETTESRSVETPSLSDVDSQVSSDLPTEGRPGRPNALSRPPTTSAAAAPSNQARPGAQAPTPGRTKPPMDRTRYQSIYIGCIDWCLSAEGLRQGDGYALSLDLCVAVGARTRRFSYATTQELDLWVTTNEASPAALWTWSLGQQFPPHEHHIDIGPGECVSWQTLWDATDETGKPLEPGYYRLLAKSLAEQTAPNSTTESTFQISD